MESILAKISTRKKLVWMLTSLWVVLFFIVFVITHHILNKSTKAFEQKLAYDGSKRAYQAFIVNLREFSQYVSETAKGEDARDFIKGTGEFSTREIAPYFLEDLKVDYGMVYDAKGKMLWGQRFYRKTKRFLKLPKKLENLYPHLDKVYIGKTDDYHIVELSLPYNVASYVSLDNKLYFMSSNLVFDGIAGKGTNLQGTLVFLREIDKSHIEKVAKQVNYRLKLIDIDTLNTMFPGVVRQFKKGDSIVLKYNEDGTLSSFRQIQSFNNELIYALEVDVPREIYKQTHQTAMLNLIVVVLLSLLATGSIIGIILYLFNQQERITNSFERFVPQEFLQLLGKDNIVDVQVGHNVEREISVMFTDMRDFTTVSEGMSAEMNFNFVNAYLSKVAPAIAKRHGFIDKYIGDGIMALFHREPTSPDDAVQAALQLLEQLHGFNAHAKREGWPVISLGIGINTGMLRLGIIGEGQRLEGTAISDTVNTAARIESMTKYYGVQLMVSESTLTGLDNQEHYHIRFLDEIRMKGKTQSVNVYEVYDADSNAIKAKKDAIKDDYFKGYQHYKRGEYKKALVLFNRCLNQLPDDLATQYFIGKCKQAINRKT